MIISNQQITTWGHKRELWDAAKQEAQAVLEEIAKGKSKPIFYSELNRKIRSIVFEPNGHDFHGLLGQLSEESDADGRGMISALVVHKEDGRPGRGFFSFAKDLGRDISDQERCWSDELNRVYCAFATTR
jgi:hypothetical protein